MKRCAKACVLDLYRLYSALLNITRKCKGRYIIYELNVTRKPYGIYDLCGKFNLPHKSDMPYGLRVTIYELNVTLKP